MNGWLGLIHQGLSPWKKRQASLGAPTDWLSGGRADERTSLGWHFNIIIAPHAFGRRRPPVRCSRRAAFADSSFKNI